MKAKPFDHHSLFPTNVLLWAGSHAFYGGSGQSRVETKPYLCILNGPVSFKVTAGFLPELNSGSLRVRVMELKLQHEGETYSY